MQSLNNEHLYKSQKNQQMIISCHFNLINENIKLPVTLKHRIYVVALKERTMFFSSVTLSRPAIKYLNISGKDRKTINTLVSLFLGLPQGLGTTYTLMEVSEAIAHWLRLFQE